MVSGRNIVILFVLLALGVGAYFLVQNPQLLNSKFLEKPNDILLSEFSSRPSVESESKNLEPVSSAEFLAKVHLPNLKNEERLDLLTMAVDEGTLDSLTVITPESVNKLNSYDSSFTLWIKRILLDSFLRRFGIYDRGNWAAIQSGQSSATAASIFVADVSRVNPELGRFVNSSAHLFSGLEYSTSIGSPFELEAAAQFLGREFPANTTDLTSGFDTFVINDPAFVEKFETERAHLLMLYIQHNPDDSAAHVRMLRELNPAYVPKPFLGVLRQQIRYLGTSAPRSVRLAFLAEELEGTGLLGFKKLIPNLDKVLAEIFVLGSLDLIEQGDNVAAATYLRHSTLLAPGLTMQRQVRSLLLPQRKPKAKVLAVAEVPKESEALESVAEPDELTENLVEIVKEVNGNDELSDDIRDASSAVTKKLSDIEARIEQAVDSGEKAIGQAAENLSPSVADILAAETSGSTSFFLTALLGLIVVGFPVLLMVVVSRYRVRALSVPEVEGPPEFSISPDWHKASAPLGKENVVAAQEPINSAPLEPIPQPEASGLSPLNEGIELERLAEDSNDDSEDEESAPFRLRDDDRPLTKTIMPRQKRR